MYTPTFEDLAGDESTFLRHHFNREPLLRRAALPVDPGEVLSIADLDELLGQDAVRLPYLRIAKGGSSIREANYSRTRVVQNETVTDAVDPDRVRELFRTGATITWNSINHVRPNLRELTAALNERFATRSDAIAFLTPAGRQGYAPHHDPVDVFVVQLAGTKEWRLWKTPADRSDDTGHYDLDELGDPAMTTVLRPGDVLYMPYSTPHVAAALDEMSLHLSIVVQPRLWRDLVARTVTDLLAADPAFADFPYLGDRQASSRHLGWLLSRLAELLSTVDVEDEIDRIEEIGRAEGRDSRRGTGFADLAAIDRVDAEARLTRAPAVEFSFGSSTEGRTTLVVQAGAASARVRTAVTSSSFGTIKIPDAVAERLRSLGPDEVVLAGDLYPGAGPERSVSAAKGLARLGILAVAS